MKAKEYIYKHYGTHKTSQLPDSFDFENVVDMMNHYALKKCKEQRELCESAWAFSDEGDETYQILNAPEPDFE